MFFGISLCCNAYNSRGSIDYINIHLILSNNNMSNILQSWCKMYNLGFKGLLHILMNLVFK